MKSVCASVVNSCLWCASGGGTMSVEVDLLLQEAKESIEAAQNYRSELQQRLHGLNQARKQVPCLLPPSTLSYRLNRTGRQLLTS